MVEEAKFFHDTYAIIELEKSNQSYVPYAKYPIVTNILCIGELYLHHLKYYNKEIADYKNKMLNPKLLEINNEIIIEAMQFKFINIKKNISLPDCVGYVMAKKYNLKFLTGDREFRDMSNVEFVTKEENNEEN